METCEWFLPFNYHIMPISYLYMTFLWASWIFKVLWVTLHSIGGTIIKSTLKLFWVELVVQVRLLGGEEYFLLAFL